ncbi:hypothetical protein Fot_28179 [Forsythia ovata]|uniref:Uncharacterized protein n=1 Tax=Forsythia ovata TaxID=205694 RepID=A0ABD1TNP0_9LAMI
MEKLLVASDESRDAGRRKYPFGRTMSEIPIMESPISVIVGDMNSGKMKKSLVGRKICSFWMSLESEEGENDGAKIWFGAKRKYAIIFEYGQQLLWPILTEKNLAARL